MLTWSLILTEYDYTIEYRECKNNKNTDAVSSLPLRETVNVMSNPSEEKFNSNI